MTIRLDPDHDLADMMVGLDMGLRHGEIGEREGAVDDRSDLALAQCRHQIGDKAPHRFGATTPSAIHPGSPRTHAASSMGFSADAARLVRIIDQSPLFSGATLTSAITPDANERKDRFSIVFKLRGARAATARSRVVP